MPVPELPWTVGRVAEDEEPDTCIIGTDHCFFARVVGRPGFPAEDMAEFIVRAMNSYDALVAALRIARDYVVKIDGTMSFVEPEKRLTRPHLDQIDAALALAEGKTT